MIRKAISVAAAAATLALAQFAAANAADSLAARRHAYFEQQGGLMKAISDELRAGKPPSPALAANAGKLKALAAQLPGWFPKGSGPEGGVKTAAKTEIWSDSAGFGAVSDRYIAETAKLEEVSRAGDLAAIQAQTRAVGAACRSCHEKYRNNSLFGR